ncbi:MAG: aminotransferase class I/II-fold pyridoxal phosphate-dependent enzyme [Thermoanaerobaculia bacterium]
MTPPITPTLSPPIGPVVHLNDGLRQLKPSATVAINERSAQLRRDGRRIFRLGFGQSPFPVPAVVVEELRRHAHEKNYLPVRGLAELRQAVADHHRNLLGDGLGPEQVLVGPGSKELMFHLQLAYEGDLLLPSPSWVSYAPQARILGRRVEMLPTRAEDGWCLQAAELDRFCRRHPERPRLLILNYPSNPVGTSFAAEDLAALAEVARRHRLLVLSDEIYGRLDHRGEHESIAPLYPEGTILSSGLSKWCGAGGWRLGVFVFPQPLRWLLDAMATLASETFTTTSAPIQYAAVRAYRGGQEIDDYLLQSRRVLGALGRQVAARLRQARIAVADPRGGFYLFPDFTTHADRLRARGVDSSEAFCERLLTDTGVALLPGADFGRPPTELTARLAYVDFDGRQALESAARIPSSEPLDETYLSACCGATLEGVDRLCDWLDE